MVLPYLCTSRLSVALGAHQIVQEHAKFETVSGMEGDNSLLLARTIALSDDNLLIIMLYKFLLKSLFSLLSLSSFSLFFFLSFFGSRRGDPPLAPHGSATALIHYTTRLA